MTYVRVEPESGQLVAVADDGTEVDISDAVVSWEINAQPGIYSALQITVMGWEFAKEKS